MNRYALTEPAQQAMIHGRQRALIRLLRREGVLPLGGKRILEVGCGSGRVLLELLSLDADFRQLAGVDRKVGSLAAARRRLPGIRVAAGDAACLPFAVGTFDLVVAFTLFTSLRGTVHEAAAELLRVTSPNGAILWYDYWPGGLTPQQTFSGCRIAARRVTLAPPLVRLLAGAALVAPVEALRILNTHTLAVIRHA
ncbi:MAG: class I SAM-dependent methyltransferase [Chloroflexi bacterium]|nr:class I SAM-dependent methyltransferase [Chloroflexota bacterium]